MESICYPLLKKEIPIKPHKTLFWRSGNHQSVLHENWKYIISKKEEMRWLFDTSLDPLEKNNLIESHPDEVQLIENLLAKFNSEQQDPLFPSSFEVHILMISLKVKRLKQMTSIFTGRIKWRKR